jgi:hypothetical protein
MPSTDGHFKIFYGMHMGLTAIQHYHMERRVEGWGICIPVFAVLYTKLSINLFIYESRLNHEKIEDVLFMQIQILNLAIVPVAEASPEHFAKAIDAILADRIIATVAAITIMIVGLAIKACLFFCNIKRHSIICYKHYLC